MTGSPVSREEFDNLYRDVNGNGHPGVKQNVEKILAYVEQQVGMEQQRAKDRSRRRWIAGVGLPILVAGLGYLVVHVWNYIEPPAAQIILEYYANHPAARVPTKPSVTPMTLTVPMTATTKSPLSVNSEIQLNAR